MKKQRLINIILFLSLLIAAGCSPKPAATPEQAQPTQAAQADAAAAPVKTAASEPTAQPQATVVSVEPGDAKEAIINAMQLVLTVPCRVTTVMVSDQPTITYVGEFVPPDRYHLISDNIEAIVIGKDAYIKEGEQWILSPIDAEVILEGMKGLAKENMDDILNPTYLGTDTIDGKAVRVYSYEKDTELGGLQVASSNKIWISETDGLPLKVEVTTETDGVQTTLTSTYVYDEDIKIEAPVTP